MGSKGEFALENGLDLRQLLTTGSVLHINEDYDNNEHETVKASAKTVDFIGKPIKSLEVLKQQTVPVDEAGLVKKMILEEGGGLPLHKGCTVYIAFSGYWENELEPFDVKRADKPLVVNLQDSGLLPGLHIAIESMLVGEMSVFHLSYKVMYGELGIPPRIKAKANCAFYIKLLKSILTPKEGNIDFAEPNIFQRVLHDVKMLYGSGVTLYKTNNYTAAIQLFRKAVFMLHKCRLADEQEEAKQECMLKKLYTNLAVCNNLIRQPLKVCVACNELNRLNSLWNNAKVLFQNAKALRMIGQFDAAEKRLKRAMKLCPENKEISEEYELLKRTRDSCNQSKLIMAKIAGPSLELLSENFKEEVDKLILNFKENVNLCKLTLPEGLNFEEIAYIKKACIRENLFFNMIQKDFALDKDEQTSSEENSEEQPAILINEKDEVDNNIKDKNKQT